MTLQEILSAINSEEIRSIDDVPEEFRDVVVWSAGYLPDYSPYCLFATEEEANDYCDELDAERDTYTSDYMAVTLRAVLS